MSVVQEVQQVHVGLTLDEQYKLWDDYKQVYDGLTGYNYLRNHFIDDTDYYVHAVSAANSFQYFCEDVLEFKMNWHSYEIANAILNNNHVVTKAPRGHAKSTTLQLLAAWLSIFPQNFKWAFKLDPRKDFDILQISYGDEQAIEWQYFYQEHLSNALAKLHLPIGFIEKTKGGVLLTNQSRCRSRGMTGALRGRHPHLILCDDLLTDRRYLSDALIESIFYQSIMGMAMPSTKVAVVGTPLRFNDLLADLSELPPEDQREYTEQGYQISKKGFVYLKYRAREVNGDLLWKEFRPEDYINTQEKILGSLMFAREYLCEPVTDQGSLFPGNLLETCNRDNQYFQRVTGGRLFVGCDLARSLKPRSSNTAFVLWEELAKDVLILRDFWEVKRHKSKPKVAQLYLWDNVYSPPLTWINVENNQFQDEFVELIGDSDWRETIEGQLEEKGVLKRPLRKLPAHGDPTTGNKNSMKLGVPSMLPWFEQQQLLFPTANEYSIEKTLEFQKEFSGWILNPETEKPECLHPNDDKTMATYIMLKGYRKAKSQSFNFYFPEV